MAQFEPAKPQIDAAGGSLVFIAAEKRNGMFKPEDFLRDNPISFPFLLDEDRLVTKAFGVYHLIGMDALNIARPATFVIGHDGVIKYVHVGVSQHDRAPLDDVLAALTSGRDA